MFRHTLSYAHGLLFYGTLVQYQNTVMYCKVNVDNGAMPNAAGNAGNKAVSSVWSTWHFCPIGRNAVQFCSSLRCCPGFFRNVATYVRNHNASQLINSNFWNDTRPKRGNGITVQPGGTCTVGIGGVVRTDRTTWHGTFLEKTARNHLTNKLPA